ncbi:MAG: ABC transporter ATP-binding protein [Candidatus Lokiarchaeota archaeon]|nr:ABC transporter ATP-binding protein [Candidatus Lokiarchaeota archaeon]
MTADATPATRDRRQPFLLARLFPFMRAHLGKYAGLFVLSIITALIGLLPPLFMQIAIDTFATAKDLAGIQTIILLMIMYGVLGGLIGFASTYLREYLGQKVVMDMRVKLYSHVNELSFSYFDNVRTGEVMARVMQDVAQLQMYMTMGVISLTSNLVTLAGVVAILFSWNPIIGSIFLIDIPFILVGMRSFSRRVAPANARIRKANGVISASIQDCLNGIREVKLYGREEFMLGVFDKWNDEYFNAVIDSNKQHALWMPYVPFIVSASSAIVMLVGGLLVVSSDYTPGLLIATIAYFTQLAAPLRMVTRFLGLHATAKAAGARIFDILDLQPAISDTPGAVWLDEVRGHVKYHGVSFHYHEGHDILKDITLDIPAGRVIAFVGPSGVGKTTLLHLLPRFYDVSSGEVTIDGRSIKSVTLESLRMNVGIVMQDTFLFDGSFADNIAFGKPYAAKEEIVRAASVARLNKFIESLPQKYNTMIGERGVFLSGGQAQRLALARVIITDPKILILDEPTANVDAVTDKEIMDAVRETMRGRTTLVIAHRLWTIQHADMIVLLKDGRIEAKGTHQELLGTSAFYREFFASQIQAEDGGQNKNHDETARSEGAGR